MTAMPGARHAAPLEHLAVSCACTTGYLKPALLRLDNNYLCCVMAGTRGSRVLGMAWDAHGERLAVAVSSASTDGASVVLYSTATQPMLTARYIGRIECGAAGSSEGQQSPADARGNCPGVALAFQPGFEKGSLLAVRCGDIVKAVPLYFEPIRQDRPV